MQVGDVWRNALGQEAEVLAVSEANGVASMTLQGPMTLQDGKPLYPDCWTFVRTVTREPEPATLGRPSTRKVVAGDIWRYGDGLREYEVKEVLSESLAKLTNTASMYLVNGTPESDQWQFVRAGGAEVPRNHCNRCDRCGWSLLHGQCSGCSNLSEDQKPARRSHCGCGLPYALVAQARCAAGHPCEWGGQCPPCMREKVERQLATQVEFMARLKERTDELADAVGLKGFVKTDLIGKHIPVENTTGSVLTSRGPRWTRDGFNRCQGPGYEKWCRFLAASYEQSKVQGKPLSFTVAAVAALTEEQVDECLRQLSSLEPRPYNAGMRWPRRR